MNHIIQQLDISFTVKVFAGSFSAVALYVVIVNSAVYLSIPKPINDVICKLMKRFLFTFPFMATAYGFAGGLVGYFGILVTSTLISGNSSRNTLAVSAQPKTALVIFTLFGVCFGVLVGLASFIKAKRASSIGLKKV